MVADSNLLVRADIEKHPGGNFVNIAIWIIAVCEVIRALQNAFQLFMTHHDTDARDNAYKAFIDSLKDDDRTMVHKLLEECERMGANEQMR